MEERPKKTQICGIDNCRSRKYHEGEDGFLYCSHGHRQGGLVRGEDDEDNLVTAARTVTRKRKELDESAKKVSKSFSGKQALDLYLKCLQLILRHQVWFLVHKKGLSAELEMVIHDLWALRISQLGEKIASVHSESDSQSQPQVFNTLDTDDKDVEQGTSKTDEYRGEKKLKDLPNLNDSLALCYLGMITLRLPITPGDIYSWVTDGKLIYRRAVRVIPLTMRDRLPATYHAVLDNQYLFKHRRFFDTITDLQIGFSKTHGIIWPALNAPLLLYRYLRELALPLELYDTTTRLADLIGYDFKLHQGRKKRMGIRYLPEAHLVGCLIVCLKLLYPMDGKQRFSLSPSLSSHMNFDWDKWSRHVNATEPAGPAGKDRFTTEQLLEMEEKDIFSMTPDQLDQYLDFYADSFLDEAEVQRSQEDDDFRHALYELFPIEGSRPRQPPKELSEVVSVSEQLEAVKTVQSSISPASTVPANVTAPQMLRPGEAYEVWKKEEDLPECAKLLYEQAARLAGLSMDMLVMAVFVTEARIEQWRRRQIAREKTHVYGNS